MLRSTLVLSATIGVIAWAGATQAGPIFLTGHDPDFHAQGSTGAQNLLRTALNFATSGTYAGGVTKFLWVESDISPPPGHLIGEDGLTAIGLTEGVNYDEVDAAGLAALPNFNGYSAIVVASDFGGLLRDAEIKELVARKDDIGAFVNAGGGLAALAECGVGFPNCNSDLVNATTPLFGFVPVGVSSASTTPPYTVTPYGASLGLTNADINDPTHNSFGLTGGLNVVDTDAAGLATTLAGNIQLAIPEPATWTMMLVGSSLLGAALRKRRNSLSAA
jgi:hypothetical protein